MIDIFITLLCMKVKYAIFCRFNAILALNFSLILTKDFNCLNSDNDNLRKRNLSFKSFSVTVIRSMWKNM